jgi:lysine-specific demethylase 8
MLLGRFAQSDTTALRSLSLGRIPAPAVEIFQSAHVVPRRPVVLQGMFSEWPALRRWSPEYLRNTFPEAVVTTIRAEAGRVVMHGEKGAIEEPMQLGDYLDSLSADAPDRYLTSPLRNLPDALRGDVPPPPYCAAASWQNGNLWIGAAGTIARMHRDLADNLHTLVFGRKRVTLVAPRQSALVYPHGLFDSFPNGCRVDIERPDFTRFPKLRGVETLVTELEPGDAIYIPRRWWHHVRTLELSASVNYWWATGARRAVVQATDLFKRMRGLSR